jgi:hypothetical protein
MVMDTTVKCSRGVLLRNLGGLFKPFYRLRDDETKAPKRGGKRVPKGLSGAKNLGNTALKARLRKYPDRSGRTFDGPGLEGGVSEG